MAGSGYLEAAHRKTAHRKGSRARRCAPLFSTPASPFFLRDRFLGLGGSLAGRAPEVSENGAAWVVLAGEFSGSGTGGVHVTGLGAACALAVVETQHSDGEIRLGVRSAADGEGIGLAFRAEDAQNFWLASINLVNQEFLLQKWVNGNAADVDGIPVLGLEAGALQWISVRLEGSSIRAQLNAGSDLETVDSFNISATGFGLCALSLGSFELIEAAPMKAATQKAAP